MQDHQSPFSEVFIGGEYHDPNEAALFPPDPGFLYRSEEHTSELQSLRHLVYLHSFPTRRSSDLCKITSRHSARSSLAASTTTLTRPPSSRPIPDSCTDRKSTRLNSSHLGISYIYTLSLHDALPIYARSPVAIQRGLHWRRVPRP